MLNINMPDMNGLEATAHIRHRLPDTTVIIESVRDEPALVEAAFRAGAHAFFVKPITDFDEFYDTVRHAYRAHHLKEA